MIYFVRRGDGRIKIGFTAKDAQKRIAGLSTGAGSLDLLATLEGGRDAERALHERFAEHRVEGEWFAISADDVADVVASHRLRSATGALVKRGHVYHMRLRIDGKNVYESTGTGDKREARKLLASRLGQAAVGAWRPKAERKATASTSALEEATQAIAELEAQIRRMDLAHQADMRRGAARASLESCPAESIGQVLEYVADRIYRTPGGSLTIEYSVWMAAAKAAADECARVRDKRKGRGDD